MKIDYSVWKMVGLGTIATTHYKVETLRELFEELAFSVSKKDEAIVQKIKGFSDAKLVDYVLSYNRACPLREFRYIKFKDEFGRKKEIKLNLKTAAKLLKQNYNFG